MIWRARALVIALPSAVLAAAGIGTAAMIAGPADPRMWLPELATGTAWLVAALVAPRGARGFALVAALVAATWWLGALIPSTEFWHRALVIHAVLAVPAGLPRASVARIVVAAGYLASVVVWPWEQPAVAAALAVAVIVAATVARATAGVIAAAAMSAAAFALPVVLAAFGVPRDAAVTVWWGYTLALVASAGLCAKASLVRTRRAVADVVVELGSEPKAELDRTLGAGPSDPLLQSDLAAATAAAESLLAQHAQLEQELSRMLDGVAESHGRLLSAEADARAVLQRELETGSIARMRTLLAQLADETEGSAEGAHAVRAADHLARAMDDVMALAGGLTPPALGRGLRPALQSLADATPVPVTLTLPEVRLPGDIETGLYLIAAEALSNVGKHARASCASVRLTADSAHVVLQVTDDGVGGTDARDGLRGIRERVATMHGRLTVVSPPGSGTTITAVLPRERPAAVLTTVAAEIAAGGEA